MTVVASLSLIVTIYLCAVGLGGAYLDALEVWQVSKLTYWVVLPIVTIIWVYLISSVILGLLDEIGQERVTAAWWAVFLCLTVVLPLVLTQFGEMYAYRFRPLYVGTVGMIVLALFEYGNNRAKKLQPLLPTPEA